MHLSLYDLDPRELTINRRFKNSQTVHPRARAAQETIAAAVAEWIENDWVKWGDEYQWKPPKPAKLLIQFVFPTAANDVDGPVKRTIDAVEQGINRVLGKGAWNDNQVVDLRVVKYKGPPKMFITLTPIQAWESNFQMREELTHAE